MNEHMNKYDHHYDTGILFYLFSINKLPEHEMRSSNRFSLMQSKRNHTSLVM